MFSSQRAKSTSKGLERQPVNIQDFIHSLEAAGFSAPSGEASQPGSHQKAEKENDITYVSTTPSRSASASMLEMWPERCAVSDNTPPAQKEHGDEKQESINGRKDTKDSMAEKVTKCRNSKTACRSTEIPDEPFVTWSSFLQTRSVLRESLDNHVLSNCDGDLLCAAWQGDTEACTLLVERGADLGAWDTTGATALHFAAGAGHVETCKFLLKFGAAVTDRDNQGETAIQRAAQGLHFDVCKLLRAHAELLEQRTADLNAARQGPKAQPAGQPAIQLAEEECAEILEQRTADFNAQICFSLGQQQPPVRVKPRPLSERRPELNTDLDELECDRMSQVANRDRSARHFFPPEVRPWNGSRCFKR